MLRAACRTSLHTARCCSSLRLQRNHMRTRARRAGAARTSANRSRVRLATPRAAPSGVRATSHRVHKAELGLTILSLEAHTR